MLVFALLAIAAKVASTIPYLAHIVCSKVALQVFTAFAALRASRIAIFCGDSGAVLVVHITLREAAVLCYQYITVSRRKIVHNIIFAKSIKMLQEIEKMKGRDFVQQLLDGTVLNEKHRKIVAQVTSELE